MIPLRISIEGFMSYRDKQVLSFEGAPLWVLSGANGAGKTAVFDAITFALFGKHTRHKTKTQKLKDLINHDAKDGLAVEFDFLIEDQAYRVHRAIPQQGRATYGAYRLLRNDGEEPEIIPETESEAGLDRWVEKEIGLSFKAFTSSVMLLQGKSEKLLEEDPKIRHEILFDLMNLSVYERLHEIADERRADYNSQFNHLSKRFRNEASVSEEDLEAARKRAEKTDEAWKEAQARVDQLNKLLEQARQWEQITQEMNRFQEEIERAQSLLDREEEISSGHEKFQALDKWIKPLGAIIEQRQRVDQCAKREEELGKKIDELNASLAEAKRKRDEAESDLEKIEAEIVGLQNRRIAIIDRLSEIARLVAALDQMENARAEIEGVEEKLAAMPQDLPTLLEEAHRREVELGEAENALPLLKRIRQERSSLASALKIEQEARAEIESLDAQLSAREEKRVRIESECETADKRERECSLDVARREEASEEARRKQERFHQAAGQETCELCGQAIRADHAEKEKARLAERSRIAKEELDQTQKRLEAATESRKRLGETLSSLKQEIEGTKSHRAAAETRLRRADDAIATSLSSLKQDFDHLPDDFKQRVGIIDLSSEQTWIETCYPGADEIETLAKEVNGRAKNAKRLLELIKQSEAQRILGEQMDSARARLASLEADTPIDQAQAARREQKELANQREDIETRIRERESKKAQTSKLRDEAKIVFENHQRSLLEAQAGRERAQSTRLEIERNLQASLANLPDEWRAKAESLDRDELEEYERERERLAIYVDLRAKLQRARQTSESVKNRISELKARMNGFDEEARRSVAEIRQHLESATFERGRSDEERQRAATDAMKIEQQREQRLILESELREADRNHHLYKLLSGMLGREGLQLELLRRAEQSIVEAANEILDGLSRGRMKLRLRESSGRGEKALDLEVFDYDTGSDPIPVFQTSGSQRFRIAVSLALAVGRYAGEEARRIESVIIDEGFGSLDREGRDDMIQELEDLKQHLKKIVLVSHQEEFAGAFKNGYEVRLVEKASQVRLLNQG
jgi:exonuclease SbcC